MADKFRVGQRVRIVASAINPERVGLVCTISRQRYEFNILNTTLYCYDLSDGLRATEECLEPVYDGDQKSSWQDCEWKPQTERKPNVAAIK
jgi:hypothetical protein